MIAFLKRILLALLVGYVFVYFSEMLFWARPLEGTTFPGVLSDDSGLLPRGLALSGRCHYLSRALAGGALSRWRHLRLAHRGRLRADAIWGTADQRLVDRPLVARPDHRPLRLVSPAMDASLCEHVAGAGNRHTGGSHRRRVVADLVGGDGRANSRHHVRRLRRCGDARSHSGLLADQSAACERVPANARRDGDRPAAGAGLLRARHGSCATSRALYFAATAANCPAHAVPQPARGDASEPAGPARRVPCTSCECASAPGVSTRRHGGLCAGV